MPAPGQTPPPAPADEFSLVGNVLCIDFVNTEVVAHGTPVDRLGDVDALLRWARMADVVDEAALRRLPAGWRSSREAGRLLQDAKALRAPIAESAAWLLEHGDRALIRRCENPRCIRFFYDTTKNRRRRWCSMDACGSRAKAAAYYERVKAGQRVSAGRPRRAGRPGPSKP